MFNLDAKIARIVLKRKLLIDLFYVLGRREWESIVHFVKSFVFTIVNDTFERGRARDERFFEKGAVESECRMGENQLGEEFRAKRTKRTGANCALRNGGHPCLRSRHHRLCAKRNHSA